MNVRVVLNRDAVKIWLNRFNGDLSNHKPDEVDNIKLVNQLRINVFYERQ